MAITLKYYTLCSILFENTLLPFEDKVKIVVEFIEANHKIKIIKSQIPKIENFVKSFEIKRKTVYSSQMKFQSKYSEWLDKALEISAPSSGAPCKEYADLCPKSKRKRLSASLSSISSEEVSDTFKAMLKKENQPTDALKIASVLPTASPKRLRRIVESIPTPTSNSSFNGEEAIALMLQLGLSRDNYITLRKALMEKGVDVLPSYDMLKDTKNNIIPSSIKVSEQEVNIEISTLTENTAARILSTFSEEELKEANNSKLQLICKWGCDGFSTTSEYKTINNANSDYKSVFMASMVPLRIRKYADSDSSSTCFKDIWKNPTPGSKAFCRPITFKYTKETKISTQDLIRSIESEIKCLEPVTIKIGSYSFIVDFDMKLTMIDGKVSNAITETSSNWNCFICGKPKSQFWHLSHGDIINEEVLKFGISPLHARIRFLEHFLHIAYDIKYRSEPQNKNKPSRNNKELTEMRANEKKGFRKSLKNRQD